MRSSCSESRRFRSVSSVCSRRKPEIWPEMYQEYATTVASVMIRPRRSAVVGERPGAREAVTARGLYQTGRAGLRDGEGAVASTEIPPAETAPDTTPAC